MPPLLVSNGPALYVEFTTDKATTGLGWAATYTGLTGTSCSGTQLLTAVNGSFTDGSGAASYMNSAFCNWLIQPANAASVTLTFDTFDTQLNADGVIVYAGPSTTSPVLGIYTGATLPPVLTSNTGAMLVRFVSDANTQGPGFSAHYTANIVPPGAPAIVGYEHWFDSNANGAIYQSITSTFSHTLNTALPTSGLGLGLHTLHLRFKDSNDQWSSVLSRPFQKTDATPGGIPELSAWEYWYDNDSGAAQTMAVNGTQALLDTALMTNGLTPGLHTVHTRFVGTGGWSSVLSRPFLQGSNVGVGGCGSGWNRVLVR